MSRLMHLRWIQGLPTILPFMAMNLMLNYCLLLRHMRSIKKNLFWNKANNKTSLLLIVISLPFFTVTNRGPQALHNGDIRK